jgi:hypothetical protein
VPVVFIEQSAGSSSTGPSALSAQNLANSSITAKQLVEYLGEDIDLFEIDSVSEADHVRLQQLKAAGEQWGQSSRIDIQGSGLREWKADPNTAQLVQIACHTSNVIRPSLRLRRRSHRGQRSFQRLRASVLQYRGW